MKKAIEILEQHIQAYKCAVEIYENNHNNQAITEYSVKEATQNIVALQAAINILKIVEQK